ncbi:hypothetical protein [Bosea massiliensis]|uniref:Core-binding (CB) domain-containing protein n=1 Tax=Bosea massiliensis TaxID=151419 RepID=A0ABW0NUS9_9HYPH
MAEDWLAYADHLYDELERDSETDEPVGPSKADVADAIRITRAHGIPADQDSLRRLASAMYRTKLKAAATLSRRAEGDYSPDQNLAAFPPVPAAAAAEKPQPSATEEPLTAETLLTLWAAERTPAPATLRAYGGKFRQLTRILGFDDLRRVTPELVVTFKEARLKEGRDAGTVADDVLAMGAVCNWAVKNKKLAGNAFTGLAPTGKRRGPPARDRYEDDEAKALLLAARKEEGWMRWLPWALCFTGARISELVELRRRDIRKEAGVWIFDIVPLAGREGKNDIFQRMVPIHPALVAEGFLDYVAGLRGDADGPLFPSITPDKHGSRIPPATRQSGQWVRGVVGITSAKKGPNHSWRHRLEDELRKVRAPEELVDAITGRYNPRNAGAGYGRGYRGMPDEVLKDLRRVPSPIETQRTDGPGGPAS